MSLLIVSRTANLPSPLTESAKNPPKARDISDGHTACGISGVSNPINMSKWRLAS
jgi:hypothetical protein